MQAWTFYLVTFGCKVNQYESQALCEAWQKLGGTRLAAPAGADVALVNSCAITARAERDARNALYRLQREAPAARKILSGCAARLAGQTLSESGLINSLVPQEAKSALLRGPWVELGPQEDAKPHFPPFCIRSFERARPVLKVQDGCSQRCTYCIVPLTRGPARSRDPFAVCEEAEALLAAGFRELVLSGINLRQYGAGAAHDFWDLISLLEQRLAPRWAGRARLRISSLEPLQLDTRGLDCLAQSRMLCPHLHLSLQSGSPEILRGMGRGHTKLEHLASAVRSLRALWPTMGLGADLLAGFPGESEAHMQESLDFVKSLALSYAHVFPYSRRPGTVAANLPAQLSQAEKAARACRLREAVEHSRQSFLHSLLALPRLHLHLDGARSQKGFSEHYAPCRLEEKGAFGKELVPVRPLRLEKDTVLVRTI